MAKTPKAPKPATVTERVAVRVEAGLDVFLADPEAAAATVDRIRGALPPEVVAQVDGIFRASKSYRDGLIIQTAYGLEDDVLATTHTLRPEGARGYAETLGTLMKSRHIAGVVSAYQIIGKNSANLVRNNVKEFDEILPWLDTADRATREDVLALALATSALTARAVLPMPALDQAVLTFHRVAVFLDALLKIPSAGAYQQFSAAAFLHATIEEAGQGGRNGLRVDTKNLNATDASSKVPGDIQVVRGQRVEEAFEVTANDWRTKIAPAVASMKSADLPRIHILAAVEPAFPDDSEELEDAGVDITVIDVAAFLRTLAATMRKPARAEALRRLYDLIERYQGDVERVNVYVRLLKDHKLAG